MNTKGVEDGTDEQAVRKVYPDAVACQSFSDGLWQILDGPPVKQSIAKHHLTYETESSAWADAAAKLPKPAELELKGEGGDKPFTIPPGDADDREDNYTEAARFAGITFSQACQFDLYMQHLLGKGPAPGFLPSIWTCDTCLTCDPKHCKCGTKPVPERTAEMEQLMGRLRRAAERVKSLDTTRVGPRLATYQEFEAAASPENILKLLDHIEGKAKAVSREVKE